MRSYAKLCEVMRSYAKFCEVLRIYANLCEVMRSYAKLCEVMRIYANSCEFMRIYAKLCEVVFSDQIKDKKCVNNKNSYNSFNKIVIICCLKQFINIFVKIII